MSDDHIFSPPKEGDRRSVLHPGEKYMKFQVFKNGKWVTHRHMQTFARKGGSCKMTPQEFSAKMCEIDKSYPGYEREGAHGAADDLLCEVLRSLGYGEGVDIYDDIEKWYS